MNRLELMSASERPDVPVTKTLAAPCRHLRSAGMYVFADDSGGDGDENYSSSSYWCSHTMKGFGPDDELAGGRECKEPSRSCYQPL